MALGVSSAPSGLFPSCLAVSAPLPEEMQRSRSQVLACSTGVIVVVVVGHLFPAESVSVAGKPTSLRQVLVSRQPSALPPSFFKVPGSPTQAVKMYEDSKGRGDSGKGPPNQGGGCHPKCWWTCGTAECDETCEPVCAPPQCETACPPINVATCRQQCDPPKCAIVCPSMHCDHGDCPQCKAVCNPPRCETVCAEACQSRCAEPQCSWKCLPGKCEKPKCSLTCGGVKACNFDHDLNARPDWKTGMHTVASGLASFDPNTLVASSVTPDMNPAGTPTPSSGSSAPAAEAAVLAR